MDIRTIRRQYERLASTRNQWESHWRDAYDFALPLRSNYGIGDTTQTRSRRSDNLFDGTAPDAVDQLSASLLSQLTPSWSRWFGLSAGRELPENERSDAAVELELIADALQGHFDRSNFIVELHQCFLDLVTVGTASLLFEEAPIGSDSAFKFTAVPLFQVYLDEGPQGRLDVTYRCTSLRGDVFQHRFPDAQLSADDAKQLQEDGAAEIKVIEAVWPVGRRYDYIAFRFDAPTGEQDQKPLKTGRFSECPFINFRWMKAPGEIYDRSPVMKALPDIRTAK